jgi:hypothetical protein
LSKWAPTPFCIHTYIHIYLSDHYHGLLAWCKGHRKLFAQAESGMGIKLSTIRPHLSSRLRIVELYLHSQIRLRSASIK